MEPNENAPKAIDGGSNSKKEAKSPLPTSDRTSEASGSSVPEEETPALLETTPPNQNRPEQKKSISLLQGVPCEVTNSTTQPRNGASSLVHPNPTGTSAKEVSILPNVPLREILEGGMNLGDSHLTSHSTLPKRKQNRPRMPNEVDSYFNSPQNPTKSVGGTLGDTNQYSVPKTTPRILRENPELENPQNIFANSFGGSAVHSPPEREPRDLSINNTPSNNALGNFVEGLPGRVSFLTKQNASSKGALEGGNSALNVSKRPKQNGPTRRALVSEPSNVSSQSVANMVSKEIHFNQDFVGGSKQSHPKIITKETKCMSLSDLSNLNPTELDLHNSETVSEIIPKTSNMMETTANEQERNNGTQWSQNSEGIAPFSNFDTAKIIQVGNLKGDSHSTVPVQKANNNLNHEGLAVPKRMLRKGESRSDKEGDTKNLVHHNDDVSLIHRVNDPKVTNTPSHQMNQSLPQNTNRSFKPVISELSPNYSEMVGSTRNKDANRLFSGGSSVPKATSQRDNAMKKNPKLEMAQNVSTPPSSGQESKDAPPSKDISEGLKTKRNPATHKIDSEKNQGNKDNTAPNVTRTGHVSKPLSLAKQGHASKLDENIGLAESSSILDLPVPDHMK
ncbi:hypothetical protein GE061_015902 [Apolygus lucorum]|uniref:Uncharacterized protein n=1 Tax=Apolygus lucorum TaxID=248454 RepID=A0A8S9XHC2_APOLU|nr:hypothetical protein GE061_015902 [Apolygus lucorum]